MKTFIFVCEICICCMRYFFTKIKKVGFVEEKNFANCNRERSNKIVCAIGES